ncbi:uncharacterized protein LOC127794229 [Diospyros lotus]|uniref:uncharacterized protein LOC127794229 n=2 Tax=Diospyros lotus TaxID=55363 RepID=UPI00224F4304|nr:uncharacterized protein LOC127794229 [Diospyros lotus]
MVADDKASSATMEIDRASSRTKTHGRASFATKPAVPNGLRLWGFVADEARSGFMAEQQTIKFTYVHTHRILPPGMRVTTHCGIKHLEAMRRALDRYKLLDRFLQGPLGHFLKMPLSLHLTAPQLIYHVLLREVTFPGAHHDEMWFEIGGTPYRYGRQEFILISGLRFGAIDRESLEPKPIEPESLRARLFPQHKKGVTGDDLELLISTREDMVSEDALKLIYIAVVDMFLLGQDERGHVDDFLWTMAEDLQAFEMFPWGTYVYSKSQHYIRLATKERKLTGEGGKKINLYGFVWAFQWWLIEMFPWIQNKWAVRLSDADIPRCRKWLSKKRPQIKNYDDCLRKEVSVQLTSKFCLFLNHIYLNNTILQARGSSPTLEPTDDERETNFWRSFNPQHSVGVDVYKFGGGGGEEEEENGGDEDEDEDGDEDKASRIHLDEKGKEENGEEKNKEKARFPDSSHHGQYEEGKEEKDKEKARFSDSSHHGQYKEGKGEKDKEEVRFVDSSHHGQYEITEMLKQTLDMLRRIDGEMSQVRTQLLRLERAQESLERGQAALERGQAALCAHLRIPHISPDHSDNVHEQSQGDDQVDPDHHDEDQASTSRLQEEEVVRVDRRPMRDRLPSQFRRPPFTDPTKYKRRKKDATLEGSDVDPMPPVLDPMPPDIETVPPEGYIEFIGSNENISLHTGFILNLTPDDLRNIENEANWLEGYHIDSYMCCLRRIQSRRQYDTNYAIMSTSFFASMVRFWEQEYGGNRRVFVPSIASVPEEWTGFVDGRIDGSLPWWAVDYVLLPCNVANSHWFLLKICLKDRRIVIYDSNSINEDSRRSRVEAIQPLVSLLPILLKKAAYYEHVTATATLDRDWEVENTDPQKLPQQPDGASCGCYVIKYVEDILRHNEDHWHMHPTVDVRTLRRQIGIFLYRHSTVVYL